MRKLEDVINQIIQVTTNTELEVDLLNIRKDVFYTAPEVMYMRWNQTHELLCEYFPNPIATEESINIFCIFTTLKREELIKAVREEIGDE